MYGTGADVQVDCTRFAASRRMWDRVYSLCLLMQTQLRTPSSAAWYAADAHILWSAANQVLSHFHFMHPFRI